MKLNHGLPLTLLVAAYILSTTWVPAEADWGSDFLDGKVAEVTLLQKKVEENQRQQCQLLRTCGAPATCSRSSCWPLELGNYKNQMSCLEVKHNAICRECHSKIFDFTRSYVRLAPTTDNGSTVTAATICSQRELDPVFKEVCNQSSLSRAFLGTVDGTYIHFPGTDQRQEDCGEYEPRFRPWYRTSTTVQKAVMVLVDAGAFGSPLPAPLKGTFHTATQDIVKDLLNTLSEQDAVNIITFDSSKATSLAPSPVQVITNLSNSDSTYHPEFDGLKGNLSKAVNSGGSSDITFGIAEALKNYAPNGIPSYNTSMKIVVVFTDGNAASLKEGALTQLVGQNVKVFIFKLPQQNEPANRFLNGSLFLSELRSIGGSFNVITSSEMKNRLYAILPYFSFVAKFRASLNDLADFSPIYEDYEHVVDNVFSITKPAFADDGKLLGIVGLNIFMDGFGNNTISVKDALSRRQGNLGKAFDPAKFVLTAANASIQSKDNPILCASNDTSIQLPSNAGLCARNDTKSTIKELACCGDCSGQRHPKLKYILIGVIGIVSAVIILITVYFFRLRQGQRKLPVFPGPPPDSERPEIQPTAAQETSAMNKPAIEHQFR